MQIKRIRVIGLEHSGGSKDYTLALIEATNGDLTMMRRWGKVGTKGQYQFNATNEFKFEAELNSRMRKDYTVAFDYRLSDLGRLGVDLDARMSAAIGRQEPRYLQITHEIEHFMAGKGVEYPSPEPADETSRPLKPEPSKPTATDLNPNYGMF